MSKKVVDPVEPIVINDELIREAIIIPEDEDAVDPAVSKDEVEFHAVTFLSFSYKDILRINNLVGLDSLVKLKLDNNKIFKLEHIDQLVHLQWLDLSFNNIEKIEGLENLTQLTDLSLFNNIISELEGLDTLQQLSALSVGNNQISALDTVMYLRQIPSIRILNLSGNPISNDADYKQYVLAHIKNLRYLDYRLIDAGAVVAARERYQDALLDIEEQENAKQKDKDKELKQGEHDAKRAAANLSGVETLFESMFTEDKELPKVKALNTMSPPMLDDSIDEYRRDFGHVVEEFIEVVEERYELKVKESTAFTAALAEAKEINMGKGIQKIREFDLFKKQTFTGILETDDHAARDDLLQALKERNLTLRDELMDLEIILTEQMETLSETFYKAYKQYVDFNGETMGDVFAKLRTMESAWAEALASSAKQLMDKFSASKEEGGDEQKDDSILGGSAEYDESLKQLLGDKELLLGSLTSCHENNVMKLDGKEDALTNNEKQALEDIMEGLKNDQHARNRLRVTEIFKLVDEVHQIQMEDILTEEDD
jgi:oligoribonuclease (3'-5' exoribonuclease)